MNRNREVYLNFGMIAFGPLGEIEDLQKLIEDRRGDLRIVYQTVSARRLYLVKKREKENINEKGEERVQGRA